MPPPGLTDTIVAVSTAWQPAPLGIIRLSGPDAIRLCRTLVPSQPGTPSATPHAEWIDTRLRLAHHTIPATLHTFHAPHSYTGQNLVEIHTIGNPPLLRQISLQLIQAGARRALPGEFTARAYLNGRLAAPQVAGVLGLLTARQIADARQAARLARHGTHRQLAAIVDRLTGLLARIEAGVDFVEEEDIRFITPAEVACELHELHAALQAVESTTAAPAQHLHPHVALVGLPNAGKSTLFNALLGTERAIVSPILGTTRDVLSSEVTIDGVKLVLQDCAGLGTTTNDLELATHTATERAADQADLILWLHPADKPWSPTEDAVWKDLSHDRCLLVLSKTDLPAAVPFCTPSLSHAPVQISAATGTGLSDLRTALVRRLSTVGGTDAPGVGDERIRTAREALDRALALVEPSAATLTHEELIALELRLAIEQLGRGGQRTLDEEVLERVFSQFCVGK